MGRDHLACVCRHRRTSVWSAGGAGAPAGSVAPPHRSAGDSPARSVLGSATPVRRLSQTMTRTPNRPSFLASETRMATWNRSTAG